MKDQERNGNEYNIDRIKDILNNIPERELPTDFNNSLRQKLHIEKARNDAGKNSNVLKKRFGIGFSFAAFIAVGIMFYTMYNDPAGIDLHNINSAGSYNVTAEDEADDLSSLPKSKEASDSGEGAYRFNNAISDQEESIRVYLNFADFKIISKEKNEDTNQINFKILILNDKDGNPVNRTINLIEDGGEFYEREE